MSKSAMEPKYNMKSPAVKRLMKEAHELSIATSEYYAQPLDDNLFEWHFTVRGPSETEFQGGVYHGRIILPPEYPMKPPSIILLTPNGRFETNRKICLSISGHHPESWQPSWSIRTALLAIIGFMPTPGHGAIGSLDYSPEERKKLAIKSQEWQCESCNKIKDLLLEVSEENNAATALEAKEIVSQISMKTEGSKERNEEKEPSSPALQESEQPELRQRTVVQSNMNLNLNQNPIIPTPSSGTVRSPRWDNRRYNILITFLVLTLAALAYRRCFVVGWDV